MSSWSQSGGGRYQSGNDRYQSSGYGNSGSGYGSYGGGGQQSSGQQKSGYPAPSSSRQPPAPTPSSRGPAPSASGGSGGGPTITVSGCTNPTVSNIIKGTYAVHSKNHEKPVYKKEGAAGSVSVLMYFWDDRDGADFSGWWFGPKVGGDQVWAHSSDVGSPVPPASGWKVPWDGTVDKKLQLTHGGDSGGPGPSSHDGARPSHSRQDRADEMANKAAEDARRREEARKKEAQQQREREERRKREAEERQRREEEDRKRRQKEKEDQERRQKELEKRRKEEEERRRENTAATAIRKVLQKLRNATPETFDKLSSELDQVQAQNTDELGAQREKVTEEADKAVADAQKRVDDITAKREADEIKRQEEEKKRKEDEDRVQKLLAEMTEAMKEAEDKLMETEEAVKVAEEGVATQKPEEIVATSESAEKIVESTKAFLEKTVQLFKDKQEAMGDNEATRNCKKETNELHGKIATGRRSLDKSARTLIEAKEKAQRKATALKKEATRKELFAGADKDKDGKLSRKEVQAYSKTAHSFDLPDQVLDKIMKSLEPINMDNFRKLHVKVAVAKSESAARQKRAEEAERARVVEEKRQAIQKVADDASTTLDTAEGTAGEAETKSRPLSNAREADKFTSTETKDIAGEAEALVKKAEEELASAMKQIEQVEADTAAVPELVGTFDKKEVPRLKDRHGRSQKKTEKVMDTVKDARKKADQKAFKELDKLVEESVKAIRAHMAAEKKTNDKIIEQLAAGADVIKQDKYVEFVKGLADVKLEDGPDFKLEDGQAEKIYAHIAGEAGEISKQRFLELIRLYYKCVKATVLSEDVSIKSKTIRRLEVGETLECLEGPATEEGANVKRVKCLAVNDDATGWATIAGNQGTPFLLPGGNIFVCVKETVLSDSLSITDSKTIRRISKGEVIEVIEFPKKEAQTDIKRIRGKAKQDGAVGWISVCGNQGTTFLEVQ